MRVWQWVGVVGFVLGCASMALVFVGKGEFLGFFGLALALHFMHCYRSVPHFAKWGAVRKAARIKWLIVLAVFVLINGCIVGLVVWLGTWLVFKLVLSVEIAFWLLHEMSWELELRAMSGMLGFGVYLGKWCRERLYIFVAAIIWVVWEEPGAALLVLIADGWALGLREWYRGFGKTAVV